ncbi:MAG: glycosyltransferase family 4 protein [Bacteroidales bacterium]|nr:glycosyltransferase family 4 protein [Bacteroidales bacterium]
MKKIAILNQDSGYLMIDLANAFHEAGYRVTLVAGRVVVRDKPLNQNVKWLKVIKYNRSSTLKRLVTWLVGFIQMLWLTIFKLRNHKLLIVSNPPFATLLPLLIRRKFELLIYDIYPDALYEMGIFSKSSLLVKLWQNANVKVFRKAERVITISDGMKRVLCNYTTEHKIRVIPVWTDNTFLKPIPKEKNPFIKEHNLQHKFIVLYSGNLGKSHDVEVIPELAKRTTDVDILFVIIGEGDKKKLIQSKIAEYKLQNLLMLPFQPASSLPFSLASADIAIVTLGKDASKLSVPSKTYNLMSVGAIILAVASHDSEISQLIKQHEFGDFFQSHEISEILQFIDHVKNDTDLNARLKSNSLNASSLFGAENVNRFIYPA